MDATTANHVFSYAALGWKLVPLHRPQTGGGCSCGNRDCPPRSRGKHPRLSKWHESATSDEEKLAKFIERFNGNLNWGVLLGQPSGIIDVEFDSDEGRAAADKHLAGIVTPSYASGRSVHRLFRWHPGFPNIAKVDIDGLEFRLGGGGKAAQSVLPPSLHPTGATYHWLDGLSPGEADVADLPPALVAMLANVDPGNDGNGHTSRTKEHWDKVLSGVGEGGRNESMASAAGKLLSMARDISREDSLAFAFETLRAINANNSPPLSEAELKTIFGSVLRKERAKRIAEDSHECAAVAQFEKVVAQSPGGVTGWRVVRVMVEPIIYRIYADEFAKAHGSMISISVEELLSFNAFCIACMKQAAFPVPTAWKKKWRNPYKKEGNDFPSMVEQLTSIATEESGDPEDDRNATLADLLLNFAVRGMTPDARPEWPSGWSGTPVKMKDGTILFSSTAFYEFLRTDPDKFTRRDVSRLFRLAGIKEKHRSEKTTARTKQIDQRVIQLLHEIAEGGG